MSSTAQPSAVVGAALATYAPELRTIFTPPASCLPPRVTIRGALDTSHRDFTLAASKECYPPSYYRFTPSATTTFSVSDGSSTALLAMATYFSPGWCPAGYIGAATLEQGDGQTSVTCCPTFAKTKLQERDECYGFGSTLVYAQSGRTSTSVVTREALPESSWRLSRWTYYATPVYVVYEASDVSLYTTSSTEVNATIPSTTSSETTASTTTSTSATGTTSASASDELSTGAKAGIGVGAALAGLFVIAAALWYIFRRRKQRTKPDAHQTEEFAKPELSGEGASRFTPKEKDGAGVNEVSGEGRPAEMAPDVLAELDAGWRGHEAHAERS